MCADIGSECVGGQYKVYKRILWLNLTHGKCPSIFHIFEISAIYRGMKIFYITFPAKVQISTEIICGQFSKEIIRKVSLLYALFLRGRSKIP